MVASKYKGTFGSSKSGLGIGNGLASTLTNIISNFANNVGSATIPNYTPIQTNNNWGSATVTKKQEEPKYYQPSEQEIIRQTLPVALDNFNFSSFNQPSFIDLAKNSKNGFNDINGIFGENSLLSNVSKIIKNDKKEDKTKLSNTWGDYVADPWSLPAQAYAEDYANAGIDRRREINPIAQTMWEGSPTKGGLSSIQNTLEDYQIAPEAIGYQNLQDFRNQANEEEKAKANAAYNDMFWATADLLTAPIGFGTSKAAAPTIRGAGKELAERGGAKAILKGAENTKGVPKNLLTSKADEINKNLARSGYGIQEEFSKFLPTIPESTAKSSTKVKPNVASVNPSSNITENAASNGIQTLNPSTSVVRSNAANAAKSANNGPFKGVREELARRGGIKNILKGTDNIVDEPFNIEKNSIPFDEPALKGLETNIGETTNSLFTNAAKNVGKNEIARDISSSQVFKNALAELGAAGMASVPLLELAGLASSTGKEGAIANGSWDNKQVGTWVGSDGKTYMGNPKTHEIEYEFPNNSNMASWTGKYIMPDGSVVDEFVPGSVPDTPYNRKAKEMQRSLDTQRYFEKFMDTGEDPYLRGDSHDAQRFGYNVAPVYNKIVEADNANINDQTGWEFIDPYLTYEYKSNHGFKDYQDVRNALNRRMNTYDYLDDLTPEKRRAIRKEGMFETFGGEERNPKNREELYGNIAESLNRDMYDDNGNYLIDTRTAPENLDQADRFYYYANMGTGNYGEHKGAENWLNDLGNLMGADYAAAIPSRENSGFTNFRVLAADPTFNNQNIVGSYGDTVDRLWTDLFEQELRESNNEEDKKMLDESGHLKRNKEGKLDLDTRSFINEYFTRPDNYLTIDDLMNVINYKQIGTDYNAIKDFVNFMEQNAPNHDWVPVTMDDSMAEMIFGSKDPVASLAQYITNALAMQELQSGLGGPIDNNGYIDLRDINSALRDVGDNIVIGNKKDNPMFSNTSVSDKKLRGNSMYPLGDLEQGINYEGWTVPEGFSVDNRGQDNAGLYKADARDVDRLLKAMGSDYGYTRANSQDYQNYLDNLYGGFSVAPLGNTVATPRGEFVGNNNINNNEGEAIYSPEHPVMKNYINQAINNPYQYSIDPFYFTQGAYL